MSTRKNYRLYLNKNLVFFFLLIYLSFIFAPCFHHRYTCDMTDADWAACQIDRRSYTGYLFKYSGAAISFETKKQHTIALSTAEAEYMTLTETAKEALHLAQILKDFGEHPEAMTIYSDDMAAQKLAKNPVGSKNSKHIAIKEHFIRECVQSNKIIIKYKDTRNMEADMFTKALPKPRLTELRRKIGLL